MKKQTVESTSQYDSYPLWARFIFSSIYVLFSIKLGGISERLANHRKSQYTSSVVSNSAKNSKRRSKNKKNVGKSTTTENAFLDPSLNPNEEREFTIDDYL